MTVLTAIDHRRAINEMSATSCYSAENNLDALNFYLDPKRDESAEYMVAHIIKERLGGDTDVRVTKSSKTGGGMESHDVEYVIPMDNRRGYKTVRVEVKSCLCDKTYYDNRGEFQFKFQAIKPNCFDYIFFVQCHPTKGIVCKWTTRKHIMDYISSRNISLRTRNNKDGDEKVIGYKVTVDVSLEHDQKFPLYDIEDFPQPDICLE